MTALRRTAWSAVLVAAIGCDRGVALPGSPTDAGSGTASVVDATAGRDTGEGARPGDPDAAWLDAGPSISDPGTVDASERPQSTGDGPAGDHPPTRSNFADAGCPAAESWIFPDEGHSSYCGTIGDACQFVCGTMSGCVVDVVVTVLQQVHCPSDGGRTP
jgi:hypothetical protein